jgi:hypothetical protein
MRTRRGLVENSARKKADCLRFGPVRISSLGQQSAFDRATDNDEEHANEKERPKDQYRQRQKRPTCIVFTQSRRREKTYPG